MMTLREKCINALRNNTRRNEVSGTREIDMDAAADAILAAVLEHATSDEAVERATEAWFNLRNPLPWSAFIKYDPPGADQYRTEIRAAIRAAIGGE